MKTLVLTVTFFVLKAIKPDFFDDTFNLIAFIGAFVVFVLADLYSLGKTRLNKPPEEKSVPDANPAEPRFEVANS